jgi:RNA polymerase sigma factor (sigma-70 family)
MRPEDLVDRYYSSVYNLAYRTLGRREDAEDVAQQTFARALPRLAEVRQPDAVRAWLLAIAANMCQDQFRRLGRAPSTPDDAPSDWEALPDTDRFGSPPGVVELHELRVDVWRAVLTLPAQQRLVLALRELHGMSYHELAQTMRTSVAAIEALLFRARQGFRRAYGAAASQPPGNAACSDVMARLSASIDGELSRQEQTRIDGHIPVCSNCRFAARELRATSRLYGLLPVLGPSAGAQAAALLTASTLAGGGAAVAVGLGSAVVTGSAAGGLGTGLGGVATLGAVKFGLGAFAAVVITVSTVSGTTQPVEAARAPTPSIIVVEVPPAPTVTAVPATIATPAPTATSLPIVPERAALLPRTEPVSAPSVVPPLPSAPTVPATPPTEVVFSAPRRAPRGGVPSKPPAISAGRVLARVVATPETEPTAEPTLEDAPVARAPRPPQPRPEVAPKTSDNTSPPNASPAGRGPAETPNGKPSDSGAPPSPAVVPGKSANAATGKPADPPAAKPPTSGSVNSPAVVPAMSASAAPSKPVDPPAAKPSTSGTGNSPPVVPGKSASAAPSKPADAPAAKPSDSGANKPPSSSAPPAASPPGKPVAPPR